MTIPFFTNYYHILSEIEKLIYNTEITCEFCGHKYKLKEIQWTNTCPYCNTSY